MAVTAPVTELRPPPGVSGCTASGQISVTPLTHTGPIRRGRGQRRAGPLESPEKPTQACARRMKVMKMTRMTKMTQTKTSLKLLQPNRRLLLIYSQQACLP